jgi:hypothetical protein
LLVAPDASLRKNGSFQLPAPRSGTWYERHAESERHAVRAESLGREGRIDEAREAYALAARCEHEALERVPCDKLRTRGILSMSAAALWHKAGEPLTAAGIARQYLKVPGLPSFAREALREFSLPMTS